MPTNRQLKQRIRELEAENQDLTEQLDAIADIVTPEEEDEEDEDEDGSENDQD